MADHDVWLAIKPIAERIGISPPDQPFERVVLTFWQPRKSCVNKRSVEPDLTIEAFSKDRLHLRIIVEIKWEALLHANQLIAQWSSFPKAEHVHTYHLLLVRNPSNYLQDMNDELRHWSKHNQTGVDWEKRLHVMSWRELSHIMRGIAIKNGSSERLRRWAEMASAVLCQEEVLAQVGWSHTGLTPIPETTSFRFSV